MWVKKIADENIKEIKCEICKVLLDTCKVKRDDSTKQFIKFAREQDFVKREHDDYFICLLCLNCLNRIEKQRKSKKKSKGNKNNGMA